MASREEKPLKAPLVLVEETVDSLYFNLWTGRMNFSVAKDKDMMTGTGLIRDKVRRIEMKKVNTQISKALESSAEQVPLDLKAEAPAFTAHKKDGRFYLIGWRDHDIYLVRETDAGFEQKLVYYDPEQYIFSSIGLSPDEQILVAHGSEIGADGKDEGGSIFLLHLKNDTEIDSIERLSDDVNTPSYDNFADFTPDGNIIFSSWGQAADNPGAGKGDIYLAVKEGDGYTTRSFSLVINTPVSDAGPFLDRKERFILFHKNSRDPLMSDKVFISTKENKQWTKARMLQAGVNTYCAGQYGARIDHSGKYLYFTSHRRGKGYLYRVRTSDVPELSPYFSI